jgi:hypothetical protein
VRAKLGDRRLGFDDDELRRLLTDGGLCDVKVAVGARKSGDPFTVLVASGVKPAAAPGAATISKRPKRDKEQAQR